MRHHILRGVTGPLADGAGRSMASQELQQLVAAGFRFVGDVGEKLGEGGGGRRMANEVLQRFATGDVGVMGKQGEVVGDFGVEGGSGEVKGLGCEGDGFGAEGGRGVV